MRAWGSDGRSKGWLKEVDVSFGEWAAQLKIRKRLPKVFLPPEGVSCTIIREDYGSAYVVTDLDIFKEILLKEPVMLNGVVAMIDALLNDPQVTDEQRLVLERLREAVKCIIPLWYTHGRRSEGTS